MKYRNLKFSRQSFNNQNTSLRTSQGLNEEFGNSVMFQGGNLLFLVFLGKMPTYVWRGSCHFLSKFLRCIPSWCLQQSGFQELEQKKKLSSKSFDWTFCVGTRPDTSINRYFSPKLYHTIKYNKKKELKMYFMKYRTMCQFERILE